MDARAEAENYKRYVDLNHSETARMHENFKFVSGLRYGQWSARAVQQLLDEKRGAPITFNLIQPKLLQTAGSLLRNPYKTNFEARGLNFSDEALIMDELYNYDREIGRYEFEKLKFLIDFLVYRGVLYMFKDYTHNPLGNVGIKWDDITRFRFDPSWDGYNPNDNHRIYRFSWKSAREIGIKYGSRDPRIKEEIARIKRDVRDDTGTHQQDKLTNREAEFYDALGDKHKVIEAFYLERSDRVRIYDKNTGEMGPEISADLAKENIMLARAKNQDPVVIPQKKAITSKVFTFCPSISGDLVLEDRPTELQLDRYPFFISSPLNFHGEPQGLVDILKDPQMVYNKSEATMQHAMSTQGNEQEFIEEDAMEDAEYQRYLREGNLPGRKFKVRRGTNQADKIRPKNKTTLPSEMWSRADRAAN
ncbi:MAG: hypothetical protein VXB01_02610, partial [Opitutae bacterium]